MSVTTMMVHYDGNGKKGDIEVSVVEARHRAVLREVISVFPKRSLNDQIQVIATCQKSAMELVIWGDDVAKEKDRLLEIFVAFANELCQELISMGYWADYIDPCSGLPSLNKEGNCVYDEVAGMQALLKYNVSQAGPCKVLLHPRWGSSVYPATCFTTAPPDIIQQVLSSKF
mmetsp:Transcript_19163/g.24864  ORF Transcript_19163/g.24864 Transcript_19163/m.24864 type:complete len:172 (-) Transcript_19163:1008-1523(-)